MKQFFIIVLVAVSLAMFGQTLFSCKPARSCDEALALSADMRHSDREQYLLEQASRFYRQGRFADAYSLSTYAEEILGSDSPAVRSLSEKCRERIEESALTEAEKLHQRVEEMVNVEK
ncbi:MAG: hypothetical protein ACM3OC_02115 [Deltaproteobacteria bacterium]